MENPVENTGNNNLTDSVTGEILEIYSLSEKIRTELHKVIVGQDDMIDFMVIGMLTNGHILLEGVPGIAKTLSARMLAKTISSGFSRIQFTPDLMPTDIIGTSVFNVKTSEFNFVPGPIFSNIVLIDEINRSPAKTQAALFEVMEERQVSVEGKTKTMGFPFLVLATQNPIEQEGTYRLPEAQLDRFLFKIKMTYPSLEEELKILHRYKEDFAQHSTQTVNSVINAEEIRKAQAIIEKVLIRDEMLKYIAEIVNATRNNPGLFLGASPRASLSIMKSAKAMAAISKRGFVTPDDIRHVAIPVLNHRLILSPDMELDGVAIEDLIKEIISGIEVPR
ncbi:MAG: MoxR family ATPase [Bacteroidales bacterium]|nr:MoxR family ATPase [Bacteroidales bacterium]